VQNMCFFLFTVLCFSKLITHGWVITNSFLHAWIMRILSFAILQSYLQGLSRSYMQAMLPFSIISIRHACEHVYEILVMCKSTVLYAEGFYMWIS
jgi:hypothetical protein